jgi:hypothetical protein
MEYHKGLALITAQVEHPVVFGFDVGDDKNALPVFTSRALALKKRLEK